MSKKATEVDDCSEVNLIAVQSSFLKRKAQEKVVPKPKQKRNSCKSVTENHYV